jgi:hypothetical protein
MKRLLIIPFLCLLCFDSFSQKFEIGANAIAGYTLMDVESVVGMPLYDWDQFSYGGNLIGLYHIKESFSAGIDAGYHRLYYWEYAFSGFGYGTEYRWGDESTIHFGPIIEIRKKGLFAQSGVNVRVFTDGTGTVPAIMLGGGYAIGISKSLAIPIGLRTDIVFGSGTPIAVNFSIGIRFKKN